SRRVRADRKRSWVEVLRVLDAERALPDAVVDVPGGWKGTIVRQRPAAPLAAPRERLRHGERGAPAGRTDPLVVLDVAARDLVAVAQLALDLDQIERVHARGERVPAAPAARLLLGAPDVLVEADAE